MLFCKASLAPKDSGLETIVSKIEAVVPQFSLTASMPCLKLYSFHFDAIVLQFYRVFWWETINELLVQLAGVWL